MPLSEEQRQKLKELELKRGGVAFAREKTSVTPVPTVIISLGGLGAKTLNMLKGKFSRQIGSSNHVYFRMIDTDNQEFAQVRKLREDGSPNPNGELETEETISLYDPAIAGILGMATIPPIYSQLVKSSADRKGDSRQWSTADTSDRTCDAGEQH